MKTFNSSAPSFDELLNTFRAMTSAERLNTYIPAQPKRALETNETPKQAWSAYLAIIRQSDGFATQ